VHDHGCAGDQLTHLGRRTSRWNKGLVAVGVVLKHHREPAHPRLSKLIEDWDIDRIISDFADAASACNRAAWTDK
jgi:2,4-dienoyl-CoA reductase-like NADH-dependent reductase (Old Yellow Enzyme family)